MDENLLDPSAFNNYPTNRLTLDSQPENFRDEVNSFIASSIRNSTNQSIALVNATNQNRSTFGRSFEQRFTQIDVAKQNDIRKNKKKVFRLRKWQVWVFAVAFLRMLLCAMVESVNQQIKVTTLHQIQTLGYKSYIFGYILVGNLSDNSFDPKPILIAIQLTIASLCVINSMFLNKIQTP